MAKFPQFITILSLGLLVFAAAAKAQARPDCLIRDSGMVRTLDMDGCRPSPVGATEKAAILKLLPAHGDLTQFDADQHRKLDAIRQVLRAHERDGVYELKVIDVPQAWTGLHKRAVLLISLSALTILNAHELQALVAHEIGHEYVWHQYADARATSDTNQIQELELACDAISVRTLARLGLPAQALRTAIEKVYSFNRAHLGVALDEKNYPPLRRRREIIKQMSSDEELTAAARH